MLEAFEEHPEFDGAWEIAIASKLAPTGFASPTNLRFYSDTVGASLLAMNDNAVHKRPTALAIALTLT